MGCLRGHALRVLPNHYEICIKPHSIFFHPNYFEHMRHLLDHGFTSHSCGGPSKTCSGVFSFIQFLIVFINSYFHLLFQFSANSLLYLTENSFVTGFQVRTQNFNERVALISEVNNIFKLRIITLCPSNLSLSAISHPHKTQTTETSVFLTIVTSSFVHLVLNALILNFSNTWPYHLTTCPQLYNGGEHIPYILGHLLPHLQVFYWTVYYLGQFKWLSQMRFHCKIYFLLKLSNVQIEGILIPSLRLDTPAHNGFELI